MPRLADTAGYATDATAGDECSSTIEGRHVTLLESDLVHPSHSDGFVNKGDPVVATDLVGVALKSAAAATNLIPIDTEGIWYLSVTAQAASITIGQHLFITNAGLITSANAATSRNFGFALQAITYAQAPTTAVIAVKVHSESPVVPA